MSIIKIKSTDPLSALEAERAAMKCSRFQARAALHLAGLLEATETAVAASDPITQIAWQDATDYYRSSETIAVIAKAINLTDEQIDDLFRVAMTITA